MSEKKNDQNSKLSIEEAFAKLDEAIKEMEGEDVTLERSFELYKNGVELIAECEKEIDLVEKKVLALSENGEINEFS